MPKLTLPGATPVIDFDYFHFEGVGYNYDIAKELAIILIDESSIDELKGIYDDNERWDSSVGSGGSGSNFSCPSQASQRACLANHFASYANRRYESCYLSLYEFNCLKTLLDYLVDDCFVQQHRQKIYDRQVELLTMVCDEFEKEYYRKNPEYLFTLINK